MNKAKQLLNLCEAEDKWGFDLTDITAANWKKVLSAVGISLKPSLDNHALAWVWKGEGIKIHTGNDPISGKYAQAGRRGDEKDYASSIGIYGDKEKVEKAAQLIRELGSNIKEETPHVSRFI